MLLIVFGGLPGTGKTTVSRALADRLAATYLRIDAIEQAIRDAGVLAGGVGPAGYGVANAVAEANLVGGRTVVADCVNPVAASRAAWRAVAARAAARLLEVEVVCSDPAEHRRRVEGRTPDVPGLAPPTWESVARHRYEPWDRPRPRPRHRALEPRRGAGAPGGASRRGLPPPALTRWRAGLRLALLP